MFSILLYKKHFSELLKEINSFWKTETNKFAIYLHKIYFWSYLIFCIFGSIMFLVKPFYLKNSLPLDAWIPDVLFLNYYFVYFCEAYYFFYAITCAVAFDVLFEAFCIIIVLQLNILNEKLSKLNFKNLSLKNSLEKLNFSKCVEHHVLLTKFVL